MSIDVIISKTIVLPLLKLYFLTCGVLCNINYTKNIVPIDYFEKYNF